MLHMMQAFHSPARQLTTLSPRTENAPHVLVVEDEPDLREAMIDFLNMEGCVAHGADSLQTMMACLAGQRIDVLVLDLGLPDGDGLHWLTQSRHRVENKGIIITTARGEGAQRITGVKAGADAYLVKPIEMGELSSLIHNLMRRLRPQTPRQHWILNKLNWSLIAPDSKSVRLTHSEAALLMQLAQAPGRPVSRNDIITALGHDPTYYDPRRLEILVRRLRSKVSAQLNLTLPLSTVHGQGYAFTDRIDLS